MLNGQEPGIDRGFTNVIPRKQATMLVMQMPQSSTEVYPLHCSLRKGACGSCSDRTQAAGSRGGTKWKHEVHPPPLQAWLRERSTLH